MKAIEQNFSLVLFITLYKLALPLHRLDEFEKYDISTESC